MSGAWRKPLDAAGAFLGREACTHRRRCAPPQLTSLPSQLPGLSHRLSPCPFYTSIIPTNEAEKAGRLQAKGSQVGGAHGTCSGYSQFELRFKPVNQKKFLLLFPSLLPQHSARDWEAAFQGKQLMRIKPRHVVLKRGFFALNLALLCANQQKLQTHLSG